MRIRWLLALGLTCIGGCATCQPCQAWVLPSAQASPQDDRAPAPPPVPRYTAPPAEEDLPPLPVPTPPRETGKIVKTTRTETSGAANYIEVNAPGTVVIGSPGATVPGAVAAAAPAQAQAYPIVPVPVPDSLIMAAARRVGGGLYYTLTGNCPPPRAPKLQAVVPVTTTSYQMVPVQTMAMAPAQAMVPMAAPAPVQVQAAPYVAPVAPSPQAPHKRWFGR